MEIEYELTLEDCQNFAKEARTIKRLQMYLYAPFVIIAICFMFFSVKIFLSDMLIFSCLIIGFLVVFFIGFRHSYLNQGKNIYKMLKGQDKKFKVILGDDYIQQNSSYFEGQYKIDKIIDIYNKENNILIFVSNRRAIIVPKRIFNTKEEINNFWDYLQGLYNKTHQTK